jgi:DNA polymerase-3 subunit delta'
LIVQASANDALINKEFETEIRTLAEKTKPRSAIKKINAIMDARTNLSHNAAPLLAVEALMCVGKIG